MRAGKLAFVSTISAILISALGRPALAQDQDGLSLSFTLGERLRSVSETGPDPDQDDGTSLVTSLGFELSSTTRTQTFDLNIDTTLPLSLGGGSDDDDDFEFEDPTIRLSYALENRNSLLTFDASFRRRDVGDTTFLGDTDDLAVTTGGGARTITTFAPRLILNREGPVTAELGYRYTTDTYSGADPSIADTTTQALDSRVTFRLSLVADAFVFARHTTLKREAPTNTDRVTTAYGVGADYALSEVTNVSASISYDTVETTDTTGAVLQKTDGLGFDISLNYTRSNGTYRLNLRSTETVNGARHQITAGRNLEMPRGTADASLGLVKNEGESVEPVVNLTFSGDISETSRINLLLSQSASTDDDDNNVIRSRMNLGYSYEINTRSSLSAGLQVANDNETGAGAIDQTTISTNVSYNYALGQEWDLVSGISYRKEKRDSGADNTRRTLFIGLEKRFDWRP